MLGKKNVERKNAKSKLWVVSQKLQGTAKLEIENEKNFIDKSCEIKVHDK